MDATSGKDIKAELIIKNDEPMGFEEFNQVFDYVDEEKSDE